MEGFNDHVDTNASLQADEIQALLAIFPDEWKAEEEKENVYSITLTGISGNKVYLQVTLPENYPLDAPPIYLISAPWMSRETKNSLCSAIEDIYCLNAGQNIIYQWIEKVKEFLDEECSTKEVESAAENDKHDCDLLAAGVSKEETAYIGNIEELPSIHHGEPIIDRKSVFQAHVATVLVEDQVKSVLLKLKENRKIASATHNIYAYRIERENSKAFLQDCDDDGETKAGAILLNLLQILNVSNVLVVVSRWYGGVHLGADRFKHINNAARKILLNEGFISEKCPSLKKTRKN